MIRIVLFAASRLVRAGIESLLVGRDNFSVAGTSSDWFALSGLIEEEHPDVALISLERQEDEPPAELSSIVSTPTVVLLDDPQPLWVSEALKSGVRAVLPADASGEELSAAMQAAFAGLIVLHPNEAQPLLHQSMHSPAPRPAGGMQENLTPRETEILRLLSRGLSNKEIAGKLEISDHTVKFHVASVMSKLGAGSRTEAVTLGLRQGLILL